MKNKYMFTQLLNNKKIFVLFGLIFVAMFLFSFSSALSEGEGECDPNDTEAICNNPGTPQPSNINFYADTASKMVEKSTPFDLSWRWYSDANVSQNGLTNRVTLTQDRAELYKWEVTDEALSVGKYSVSGITKYAEYTFVAETLSSNGTVIARSEKIVGINCVGCVEFTNDSWVSVTIDATETNVDPGTPFDVSWNADWNTAEGISGRIIYKVTLLEDLVELKTWNADSEPNLEQPPESGSFRIDSGIFSQKTYKVIAEVNGVTEGVYDAAEESITVNIRDNVPRCAINSFTADNSTPDHNTSTNLRFSLSGSFPWSVKEVGGATLSSGTSNGGVVGTGNIIGTKVFRITCGSATRDVTVRAKPQTPPGGGGGGACNLDSDANRFGEPVEVPADYVLLDVCRVQDYSEGPEVYDKDGATMNIRGTCRPPGDTDFVVLNIYTDDGGSVSVNGEEIHSVAPTCGIKIFELEVTNMTPSADNDVNIDVVNSELAGAGADAKFYFYSSGRDPGEDRTPIISAPACSDENYNVTISWAPINVGLRVFVDDNPDTPEGFDKVLDSGSSGSTPAPAGFTQRIPGAPSTLVFEPGVTYYSFIQNETTGDKDGDTTSWVVNTCTPPGGANGYLDTNQTGTQNCTYLSGWAWDPDYPNDPTNVHIYRNGSMHAGVLADHPRAGLPGDTEHGFSYLIPDEWKTGTNQLINIYAIDINTYPSHNKELVYSPATINCPPSERGPDLTAGPVSPTEVTPGSHVFSGNISNLGTSSTESGFSAIFQLDNPRNPTNPITTSNPVLVSALPGTGTTQVSRTYSLSEGIYKMRICADKSSATDFGTINEVNENNNCGAWTTITVSNSCPGPGCPTCGDGAKQSGEQCDNGGDNGVWPKACSVSCMVNTAPPVFCGDGYRDGAEQCDNGGGNGPLPSPCSTACTFNPSPVCGNNIVNTGEECDLGGGNGPWPSRCNILCKKNTGPETCGNNMREGGEQCDLGGGNGPAPSPCSGTCTLNPVNPPPPGFRSLSVGISTGGVVKSTDTTAGQPNINCGGKCSHSYPVGTSVTLDASRASSYWKFDGWSTNPAGLCSGTATRCVINMSTNVTVQGLFSPRVFNYEEF